MAKIDYSKTRNFWDRRAEGYGKVKLESITMLENFPELMDYIRKSEVKHLLKRIAITSEMDVLDLGCGVGRLSFALAPLCRRIVAVDFSDRLLDIARGEARKRNIDNVEFIQSSVETFRYHDKFDVVLIYGVLMCMNDNDVQEAIRNVHKMLNDHGIVASKETIATKDRIEKIDQYEASLGANYNVIYRLLKDYIDMFEKTGLKLVCGNFPFPPIVLPASVFRRIVPFSLQNSSWIKYILRGLFKINLFLDPLLLRLGFMYKIVMKIRGYTEAKYLCIYKKE